MNYQVLNEKDLQAITGGGQYDKTGYKIGKTVGTIVRKGFEIWSIFK
ncbi:MULTISPECIES: bacteriocin [Enterococcus]|uniref:Bacteriocin-type signal sequence n=2 Tax=Enterococcus TaxID=1350 RepID=R2S6C2_9ENTE|nr:MULTISPECIES: bacteriocin [Enterococcus]EOH91040.1 bacteriocin-type signal sequence [Enterococcus pallens ATCC BAA-351]EOU16237.1 hypothetical protein I588_03893 [Enterococcus pallens ATCC BAA-351]MBO1338245.1 bacteriocin [Enterococcus sp. 665A]OJG79023.1 bacteriocin-type signal sequence [Enterococcus pallens]